METFSDYVARIESCISSGSFEFGSPDFLVSRLDSLKEILSTITVDELLLCFYLRNSRNGELARFCRIAKANLKAFQDSIALASPFSDID